MSGWIGVDLDGTLAHYTGWLGAEIIGEPVKPMLERVKAWIAQGIEVRIFTARASVEEQIPYVHQWCLKHIGIVLPVTNVKDFGMVMLYDDRCTQVETNTGRLVGAKG